MVLLVFVSHWLLFAYHLFSIVTGSEVHPNIQQIFVLWDRAPQNSIIGVEEMVRFIRGMTWISRNIALSLCPNCLLRGFPLVAATNQNLSESTMKRTKFKNSE